MPEKLNEEEIEKIREGYYDKKKTITEIANETGFSTSTIDKYIKRASEATDKEAAKEFEKIRDAMFKGNFADKAVQDIMRATVLSLAQAVIGNIENIEIDVKGARIRVRVDFK